MTKPILQKALEEAEAQLAAVKREIAQASCIEAGHDWKFIGGANAGCPRGGDCMCSVPVHECARCGDCDYGVNDEASDVINACEMTKARAGLLVARQHVRALMHPDDVKETD